MKAVVLESYLGSVYDDTPGSYEFPSQYLRWFAPLENGESMLALTYEPRGEQGRGRLGFVGWATLSRPPEATGNTTKGGRRLWRVVYDRPVEPFSTVVPRVVLGRPVESWIAEIPPGPGRSIATRGRAVRGLDDADAQQILALAKGSDLLGSVAYPEAGDLDQLIAVAERTRRAVEVLERDARFRSQVLSAYEYRCAVSGFSIGPISRTRVAGLLDAAHIRPVWQNGVDVVRNGLALTPTLHRLFDAGLFTVDYNRGVLQLQVSPHLDDSMITAPDGSFRLPLKSGLPVRLPRDPAAWPDPVVLRHHQSAVFRT